MHEEIGGQEMFRQYLAQNRVEYLLPEIEPYLDRFPNWFGLVSGESAHIYAVSPVLDDSRERPEGNRRVKPSSELCPFAINEYAGLELLRRVEMAFPDSTRYCGIKAPVEEIAGIGRWESVLGQLGYRAEAFMPSLFTINGKDYTVADYARNRPERLSEFPEGHRLISRVMEEVVWNNDVRALLAEELAEHARRISETHSIMRATVGDVEGIVSLLVDIFPIYGTCNLETTIPDMIGDRRSCAPLVYVARRRDGEVVGTCTIERYPFKYGELTDVAVHQSEAGNGLGTTLCYLALSEARETYGLRHFFSDDVPSLGMNKIAKKLGAVYSGIHENQVRISTRELSTQIGRVPQSTSLVVCTGSTDFMEMDLTAGDQGSV